MIPTDPVGLAILLLAIVPGYVATTFWARTKTWKGRGSDLLTILQSVVASALIQVLAAPLTLWLVFPYRQALDRHEWNVVSWLSLVVLVLPFLLGTVAARLSDALTNPGTMLEHRVGTTVRAILPAAPLPTIWDWLFMQSIPDGAFVVITFADDSKVAGVFAATGSRTSYAATSPQPLGLYLAEEWALDAAGNIDALVTDTRGVMIPSLASVKTVRILSPTRKP